MLSKLLRSVCRDGKTRSRLGQAGIMSCYYVTCRLCEKSSHALKDMALPCLDPAQLKLTHVDNFWKTVETSVAVGRLVPASTEQPDVISNVHHAPLLQLDSTVIMLPRIVTRLRPVHGDWEDCVYQDLAAWDVDFVVQMLQQFMTLSSAKTVPSLK